MTTLEPRRLLAAFIVDPSPQTPTEFTYPTIGQAVTAAAGTTETDDTITIVPGSYSEDVTISTPVSLLGARAGHDPQLGPTGDPTVILSQFTVTSPGVSIDGFTFEGGSTGSSSSTVASVYVTGAGASIVNNVFTGADAGVAVLAASAATDASLSVTNNIITGWSTGVDANMPGTVTVNENDLEQNGVGIKVGGTPASAGVDSNAISESSVAGVAIDLASDASESSITLSHNALDNAGVPQLWLDGGDANDHVTLSENDVTLAEDATFVLAPSSPTPVAGRSDNSFTVQRETDEDHPLTFDLALIDGADVTVTDTTGLAGIASASGTEVTYAPDENFNGTTSFTFATAHGAAGTVVLEIAPVNDAPTGLDIPDQSVSEGGSVTLTLSDYFTDVDAADGLTYSVIGAPTFVTYDSDTKVLTIAPQAGTAGDYTFSVAASDGEDSTSKDISVAVLRASNQPPLFQNLPSSVTIPENQTVPVFDVDATDPDGDGLTYSILSGNSAGRFAINPTTGVVTLTAPLDAEQAQAYTLTIRVTDNGEPAPASADGTLNINVSDANDVATNVTLDGPTPANPVEGQSVTFTAAASDGDVQASLAYRWLVDGVERVGETSSTFTTSFGNEGDHVVRVEVSDRGAAPAVASTTVHVADSPPTIPLSMSAPTVDEGATFTLTVGTITDADPSDVAAIGQLSIDWGDGQYTVVNSETDPASLAAVRAGTPVNFSHLYDDGTNQDRAVSVRLYDNANRTFSASSSIRVNNVAPTGTFAAITPTVAAGSTAIVNWFGQTDVSAADRLAGLRFTYAIDVNGNGVRDAGDTTISGDGTYAGSTSLSQITIPNTLISEPGTYKILGLLLDKDGSPVLTRTVNIVVTAGTFRVVSVGGDHSGFTVNFNRVVDRAPVNLWDGNDATVDLPDVVLTRANGTTVPGSIVFNAAGTGFDFIATGGILFAGNYTVTLKSGNTAFQALDGTDLDGDDNGSAGGTYTAIIGVNAPTGPVLSVADFTRGPGQPIDVIPGTTSSDLPITMNSPIAISSLNFQIRYNPSLMNVTSVYGGSALSAGWHLDYSVGGGVIHVSLMKTSPDTFDIPGGFRELIKIVADVPNDPAIYGKSEVLSFASIVVNGNALLEGTSDRAIHKVVYLGDANLDGNVNIGDAGLVQSIVLQNVTGFDNYPLTDPAILVDTTQNLAIDAQDATNVALAGFTGGRPAGIPDFTPLSLPGSVGTDPTYRLPTNLVTAPGATVQVPVSVPDDARGVQSGAIRISYDPSVLTLTGQPVLAGSLLAGGWTILSNVNAAEGWIEIAFYNGNALQSPSPAVGTLFTLQFTVAAGAPDGVVPLTIAAATNKSTSSTLFYDRGGAILATTAVSGSVVIDTGAPVASPPVFFQAGTRQVVTVTFSEDVRSGVTAAGFELKNLTTGAIVNLVVDGFSADGKTVTLSFAGTGGVTNSVLKDGNYRIRVLAGGTTDAAGNAITAEVSSDFFFLNGDANHDRAVNFDDLVLLAQNYGMATGATFSIGDLNYDGAVNFDDLVILAQRYNATLAPIPPAPIQIVVPVKRRGVAKVRDDVLA